jgi:osmotically-inducible protein OsmY
MRTKIQAHLLTIAFGSCLLMPAWAAAGQPQANPTADQSKNDHADRQLVRDIRRAVVKDKSLSTYGHNVTIIAEGGKVTLRGTARSEEEKSAIEGYAKKYAGADKVVDELNVKSETK